MYMYTMKAHSLIDQSMSQNILTWRGGEVLNTSLISANFYVMIII